MDGGWTIILAIGAWIALVLLIRWLIVPWLARGPEGDPVVGLLWRILRLYARLLHRVAHHGMEDLRDQIQSGPLIVVSNHTGSVDPLLIQAGCRFNIRWMMASEMMSPQLDWLWRRQKLIPVDRDGRDVASARQALRHLEAGGTVGIFPEGRIVQPPRQIRPFHLGVGLIVARSKAPVLLVWVSGTPETSSLIDSLITPSRARIEFLELIDFRGERDGHIITQTLRERLAQVSNWPLVDQPMPRRPDDVG